MKSDKLICEEISQHIRSQIPLIARNLHEAFGQGFGERLGLLAREVGNRIKTQYHKQAAEGRQEMVKMLAPETLDARNKALKTIGIDHREYDALSQFRLSPGQSLVPPHPTAPQQHHEAYAKKLETLARLDELDTKISRHRMIDSGFRRAIDTHNNLLNTVQAANERNLSQIELPDPSQLQHAIATVPYQNMGASLKAAALKAKRKELQAQRRADIPAEYGQYKASKPVDPSVAGSSNLLARVATPYQPARPAVTRSPTGAFLPRAMRTPAQPEVPAQYKLRLLGRLLQGAETII